MNWVCEMCSSTNTEKDTKCFVCDNPRSSEDIRLGKIEARRTRVSAAEKKINRLAKKLPLYLACIICAVIIVLLIIIAARIVIINQTGMESMVENNIYVLYRTIETNVETNLIPNLEALINHI